MNKRKLLELVLSGSSDHNIPFEPFCKLLINMGFSLRHKGSSHHVFSKDGVKEIINLQPKAGKVKYYQVKQAREIIQRYHITL
jgi:hypothetical protein